VHPKWCLSLWYVWCKTCTYLAPTLTPSPNRSKRRLTWRTSPRSSIRCVQNNSKHMVHLVRAVHLSCVKISPISKRTEKSFHLSLVTKENHRVHLKRFLCLWYVWRKPCTYLTLTLTPSLNGPKQDWAWPTSPKSSIGCVQNNFLSLWYIWNKSCIYISSRLAHLQTDRNELPLEPCHQGVPSGASKMISEPMVHLAQTMHLSCTDTNTVSKWTKTRFDWPTSPRSSIGCFQNDFWAYGMFGTNSAPILCQY
jgi:hypothetical protein